MLFANLSNSSAYSPIPAALVNLPTKSYQIEVPAVSTPALPTYASLDKWTATGSYTKILAVSSSTDTQTIQSKVNNDHQTFNFETINFPSETVIEKIELVANAVKVGTQTTKMALTFAKGTTLSDLPLGGTPMTTSFADYTRDVTNHPGTTTKISLDEIKTWKVGGTGDPITFGVAQNTDGKTIKVGKSVLKIRFIDNTKPTTTPSLSGTLGGGGWYTTAVSVTLSCDDPQPGSGCNATTYSINGGTTTTYSGAVTVTADGTYTVTFRSTDKAGNIEADKTTSFKIDKTAPTTTASLSGTLGLGGWYTSAVDVTLSCTDNLGGSGCNVTTYSLDGGPSTTYSGAVTVTADGTHSISYHSTDVATNTETPDKTTDFKIDATRPDVTAVPTRLPDSDPWYNHAIDTHYDATDATSGVASCDADKSYAGSDGASVNGPEGTCYDNAGNFASAHATFAYDATPPDVSAALARGPDNGTWYNHAVDTIYSGTDVTSGPVSCDLDKNYAGPDGALVNGPEGTCTDKAGNPGVLASVTFDYDDHPPTTTATADRLPDSGTTYSSAVDVSLACNDTLSGSGCNETTYSLDDNPGTYTPGTPIAVTTSGVHTIVYRSNDNAGNTEGDNTLQIELQAATVTITTPQFNEYWGNQVSVGGGTTNAAGNKVSVNWGDGNTDEVSIDGNGFWAANHTYDPIPAGSVFVTALVVDSNHVGISGTADQTNAIKARPTIISLVDPADPTQGGTIVVRGHLSDGLTLLPVLPGRSIAFYNDPVIQINSAFTDANGDFETNGIAPNGDGQIGTIEVSFDGDQYYTSSLHASESYTVQYSPGGIGADVAITPDVADLITYDTSLTDSDVDGIPDSWETGGIPYSCATGTCNLLLQDTPHVGTSDVYVEIDGFANHVNSAAISAVDTVFSNTHPGQQRPIDLHYNQSDTSITEPASSVIALWRDTEGMPGNAITTNVRTNDYDSLKADYFGAAADRVTFTGEPTLSGSGTSVTVNGASLLLTSPGNALYDANNIVYGTVDIKMALNLSPAPIGNGPQLNTELTNFAGAGLANFANGQVTITQGANSGSATFTNSGAAGLNVNTELSGFSGAQLANFANGQVTITQGANSGSATFTNDAASANKITSTGFSCSNQGSGLIVDDASVTSGSSGASSSQKVITAKIKFHTTGKITGIALGSCTVNLSIPDFILATPPTIQSVAKENVSPIIFTEKQLAKLKVYRYVFFATSIGGPSGRAEIWGNDAIIALGAYAGGVGTQDDQAGTFMHELGHLLNLDHGGARWAQPQPNVNPPVLAQSSINCKPNYISLMSYSRQLPGSYLNQGTVGGAGGWQLDYSSGKLGNLVETALKEKQGLVSSDPAGSAIPRIVWGTPGTSPFYKGGPNLVTLGGTGTPPTLTTPDNAIDIDWSGNGVATETFTVRKDINNFGIFGCQASTGDSTLSDGNDWKNLDFRIGVNTVGTFGDGESRYELNEAQLQQIELANANYIIIPPPAVDGSETRNKGSQLPIKIDLQNQNGVDITYATLRAEYHTSLSPTIIQIGSGTYDSAVGHYPIPWKTPKVAATYYINVYIENPITTDPDRQLVNPINPLVDETGIPITIKVKLS